MADQRGELSRFLLVRGAWLIFLELVVTRCFGWAFNFDYRITLAGVLWVPMRVLTAVALLVIAGHNLLRNLTVGGPAW